MATKDLHTLNFQFDQIMFNSLIFTSEKVTFGIISALVSQINVLGVNEISIVLNLVMIENEKMSKL